MHGIGAGSSFFSVNDARRATFETLIEVDLNAPCTIDPPSGHLNRSSFELQGACAGSRLSSGADMIEFDTGVSVGLSYKWTTRRTDVDAFRYNDVQRVKLLLT